MITRGTHSRLKAALTRAIRSGSPQKIVAVVRQARLTFDREGWPDDWARWRIAVDDLSWHADDAIRQAAQEEVRAWV